MSSVNYQEIIEKVLPYFILFHGEENKDLIEESLNSVIPIFYSTIDAQRENMYFQKKKKRIELTLKFLENHNFIVPEELKEEIIRNNNIIGFNEIPGAEEFLNFCFSGNSYIYSSFLSRNNFCQTDNNYLISVLTDKIKYFGININENDFNSWIISDEAKTITKKIDNLKIEVAELDKEYIEFEQHYKEFEKIIDKSIEYKMAVEQKYMLQFVKSIESILTNHDKEILNEYMNSENKNWYQFIYNMNIFKIIGTNLSGYNLIDFFNEKSEKQLKSSETPNFVRESIINSRLTYYELLGLDKGNMSDEEFLSSKIAKDFAPSTSLAEYIISKKLEYLKKSEEEYMINTSSYKENYELIKKSELLDNYDFLLSCLQQRRICVAQSCKKNKNDEIVPSIILVFPTYKLNSEFADLCLIHELNHVVESLFLKYDSKDNTYYYKTGFEFLTSKYNLKRPYQQFSEVINHLIAIEITESMHKDNVYLFNTPNNAKLIGGALYERNNMFVKEFYEKFKDLIKISRKEKNLLTLLNVVGEDNFERLNNIINEYMSMPYYDMMNDIINNIESELTIKRQNLYTEAVEVVNRMVENAKNVGYLSNSSSLS